MVYVIFDETLGRQIGNPLDDDAYLEALGKAMVYSDTEARGHVVRVRRE